MTAARCRIHDADDHVPGRVCGLPLPCRDHLGMAQPPAKRPKAKRDWSSTPREHRRRGEVSLTLSAEARAALDRLAAPGRRSEFVERLILEAADKG
jgi:hypothetical protein